MRYGLIIFLLITGFCSLSQPIEKRIRFFSTYQGLSNKYVHCITKDDRGFLWIGTAEGLNRFDGKNFLNVFSTPDDTNSLSGNVVYDVLAYQPGRLLIATNNGLSVFNTYSNRFENDKIKVASLQKKANTLVRSLFKDKEGRIYVNHSGKIDVFSDSLVFLYCLNDLPWCRFMKGIIINSGRWLQDKKGRIWIGSDNMGIHIIDAAKRQVYNRKNNPFNYPIFHYNVIRSIFYNDENEWVFYSGYGTGLVKYDLIKDKETSVAFNIPYPGELRNINAIIEYEHRLLCSGSYSAYSANPETMEYENIDNGFYRIPPGSFRDGTALFRDDENIWMGTQTNGLIQLPIGESPVVQIPLPFAITDYSNYCTGITRADNGLFYFSYNADGLIEMDPQTFSAIRYKNSTGNIFSSTISRICEDGKKRLWVGTSDGIFEFDTRLKQFKRPSWYPPALQKHTIHYLFSDSKGNVWISYGDDIRYSIGFYDVKTERLAVFDNYKANNKIFFDTASRISRITEDDRGKIWFISIKKGGIASYDPVTGRWQSFPKSEKGKRLGEVNGLSAIAVTGNNVWTGNNTGLSFVRYQYETDSIFSITRKEGLGSENILAISKGKNDHLFLATPAGIHLLNASSTEVSPLITKNENIDWSYAYIQYYDSISNRLFYGLGDRLVVIKNDILREKRKLPHTYISRIKIDNIDFPLPLPDKSIDLEHFQKNISVDFAAPNFSEEDAVNYAYFLEGADNRWNMSGEIATANFSSLSPGSYTLKVKAKMSSGEWGPVNETLRFGVRPPFWQRMSFVLPGLLALTGLIILLVRRRINTVRREAELKHKITEAEMNALRTQMNPHFIFNCLNAIDNLIQTNQKDKATTYLARFAKLIRWVLDSSKNNVVPFQKDYETLQLYLQMEQFRCDNKFEYQLTADPELQYSDYKVPPLIVQPFVENAIHHGLLNKQHGLRKLILSAAFDKDFIKYTITDNGVGRVRAQQIKAINKPEYQSYGLNITRERIQLHNQSQHDEDVVITDLYENNEPAGTKVTVWIKIYDTA
jgi:ligand-binding sensor domain-containing protein